MLPRLKNLSLKCLLVVFAQLHRLPIRVMAWLGSAAGSLAYWLLPHRRRVTLRNLELCFPELSVAERTRLAKKNFRVLLRSFLDRAYTFHGPQELLEKTVTLKGAHFIDEVLDRPIILFMPHFAGIETGSARIVMRYKTVIIYKKKKKNLVIENWRNAGRTRFNDPKTIPTQAGIRAFIRAMKPGIPVFYLPDIDGGRRHSIFVDFFGIPAATITSLPRLAKITGAAVIPVIVEQTETGYVTHIHKHWENFPTDDIVADTTRMNRFIENEIRKKPESYYWFLRRFRTRPKKHPPLY